MSTRSVLFGKSKSDNILERCDLNSLLYRLGIVSLVDVPMLCYIIFVVEFYANPHKYKFDNTSRL